jgi:serine/threonine protein phosphatase PrpC
MARMDSEAGSSDDGLIAYKTDIGRKHHVNQDAGGAWSWTRPDGGTACLLVVADGVSAGRNSEGASRLAVEVVFDRLAPLLESEGADVETILAELVEAIKDANHQIAARPHLAIGNADATTIVATFALDREAAGAWVGDSRIYRVSGEHISRLTVDHSWAQGVVSRGLMSEEEAARDHRAHMIMRWLGPPDQDDPGIDTFRVDLDPGDIVFCCTDGLYMYFAPPVTREEEMARIFSAHPDHLAGAIDQLVDTALARGGYDNITVAALCIADSAGSGEEREDTPEISPVAPEAAEENTIDREEAAADTGDDPDQ